MKKFMDNMEGDNGPMGSQKKSSGTVTPQMNSEVLSNTNEQDHMSEKGGIVSFQSDPQNDDGGGLNSPKGTQAKRVDPFSSEGVDDLDKVNIRPQLRGGYMKSQKKS